MQKKTGICKKIIIGCFILLLILYGYRVLNTQKVFMQAITEKVNAGKEVFRYTKKLSSWDYRVTPGKTYRITIQFYAKDKEGNKEVVNLGCSPMTMETLCVARKKYLSINVSLKGNPDEMESSFGNKVEKLYPKVEIKEVGNE